MLKPPLLVSIFVRFTTAETNSPGVQRGKIRMTYDGSMIDEHDAVGQNNLGMRRTGSASAQYARAARSFPEVRRVVIRTAYDGSTFDEHDDVAPGVRRTEVGSAQEGRAEYLSKGLRTVTADYAVDVRRVASRSNGDVEKRAKDASELEIHSPSRRDKIELSVGLADVAVKFRNGVGTIAAHVRSFFRLRVLTVFGVVAVMLYLGFVCETRCADSNKHDAVAARVPSEGEVVVADAATSDADATTVDVSSDGASLGGADTSSDDASSDVCALCQMATEGRDIELCDECAVQAHASQYRVRNWSGRLKKRSSRF
jgi:hypothetical protein